MRKSSRRLVRSQNRIKSRRLNRRNTRNRNNSRKVRRNSRTRTKKRIQTAGGIIPFKDESPIGDLGRNSNEDGINFSLIKPYLRFLKYTILKNPGASTLTDTEKQNLYTLLPQMCFTQFLYFMFGDDKSVTVKKSFCKLVKLIKKRLNSEEDSVVGEVNGHIEDFSKGIDFMLFNVNDAIQEWGAKFGFDPDVSEEHSFHYEGLLSLPAMDSHVELKDSITEKFRRSVRKAKTEWERKNKRKFPSDLSSSLANKKKKKKNIFGETKVKKKPKGGHCHKNISKYFLNVIKEKLELIKEMLQKIKVLFDALHHANKGTEGKPGFTELNLEYQQLYNKYAEGDLTIKKYLKFYEEIGGPGVIGNPTYDSNAEKEKNLAELGKNLVSAWNEVPEESTPDEDEDEDEEYFPEFEDYPEHDFDKKNCPKGTKAGKKEINPYTNKEEKICVSEKNKKLKSLNGKKKEFISQIDLQYFETNPGEELYSVPGHNEGQPSNASQRPVLKLSGNSGKSGTDPHANYAKTPGDVSPYAAVSLLKQNPTRTNFTSHSGDYSEPIVKNKYRVIKEYKYKYDNDPNNIIQFKVNDIVEDLEQENGEFLWVKKDGTDIKGYILKENVKIYDSSNA
jgi:hypothetical protein